MWQAQGDPSRRLFSVALAAVLASGGLVAACGDDDTGPSEVIASVVVDPPTAPPRVIAPGTTVQLTAVATTTDGVVVDADFTWKSSNEAAATVSNTGLVTGQAVGAATITAAAAGKTGTATVIVEAPVASIAIEPAAAEISVDEVIQFVATAKDANGQVLVHPVTWTSSNPAVAAVDEQGLVTGKSVGSVTISASAGGKQASGSVNVQPKAAAVTVTSPASGNDPLEIGLTLQLTATVTDALGNVIVRQVTWTSSDPAIATVDGNGLVTGVASGTVTITAAVQQVSGTFEVRVTGESEETTGNNLSWPVVFAEGVGLTGAPVATDPGIRPLSTETDAYAELLAIAPSSPSTPFFFSGNVPNCGDVYYCQGTASSWRAQIVDGTGQAAYDASAYWGDNIAGGSASLRVDRPIRVEMALSTTDGVTLLGYNMPYVVNPSSPDEIQGTDGSTVAQVPLIYSGGPTLTIEQLSGPGGSVIGEISSAVYKAEINVGGRIIYGAQFKPTAAGTYRLRFILATGANVRITEIGNATGNITLVSPKETAIEVQVAP